MPKINLLYVITKLELGGAQKQLLALIANLNQEKYNLFLFTASKGPLLAEALSISGLKIRRSRFLERTINPLKDALALAEIFWLIKRNKIRIVHTHSSKAGILGRWAAALAGTKLILHTVHGWPFHEFQQPFCRMFFRWLERRVAKVTTRIIVVSASDKKKGLENRIGTDAQYSLIRYGIDYSRFNAVNGQNLREELGISRQDLLVGTVSCLKPQKCPQDFIRLASLVCRAMPRVKFIIAGDGISRAEFDGLINRLGLGENVLLLGWREDIPELLAVMDVFVLTSLWEGLPISVLEAMAASRPVIATDTGAVAEVITEAQTGFLVQPRDMDLMAQKLLVLLNDEQLRKLVAGRARDSLGDNFTVENMVRDTESLYGSLLKEG